MPAPSLHDDGSTVTLDLHGLRVDEALHVTQALVREAARRGRSTVRLIHGASTSSTLYRNRTIKHELESLLDTGAMKSFVTSVWKAEGHLLLSLTLSGTADPTPIRPADISR
ncbi:MAG TPA: Smr/MutS family protein [Rhodothermales bacterium]|nr:Smr/MutS family protein [Rhodothermales bacterium]